MGMPWEAGEEETPWSDRDGWRGALHPADVNAWSGVEAPLPAWWVDGIDEGELEMEIEIEIIELEEEWPEDMAGPEYWLFKRDGM